MAPCLDSLRDIDFPRDQFEVIVVDNGSIDGSRELLRDRYPSVRVIENDENLGYARANNQAAAASLAKYMAFLNNDTRVDRRWLTELVAALDSRSSVAAVGSLILNWRGRKIDFATSAMSPFGEGFQVGFRRPVREAPRDPQERLFVNGAGMLVRRELFIDVGGFDERYFAYYEDVDLGWRLWVLGWEVMLIPSSRVYHRHNASQRSLDRGKLEVLFARNALMSVVKNYDDDNFHKVLPIALMASNKNVELAIGLPDDENRISLNDPVYRLRQELPHDKRNPKRSPFRIVRDIASGRLSLRHKAVQALVGRLLPGAKVLPISSMARVTAMADLLAVWPELLATRREIQSKRKRPDSEIFRLMHLELQVRPRKPGTGLSWEYFEAFVRALEAVGLSDLVPTGNVEK